MRLDFAQWIHKELEQHDEYHSRDMVFSTFNASLNRNLV